MLEITASGKKIEWKIWQSRDLWDIIKHINICIIGVPEGEEI